MTESSIKTSMRLDSKLSGFGSDKFLSFTYGVVYGDYGLILPRDLVSRVVENYQLCSLPTSVDWFLGMANIDGQTAPVFDFNLYLLNEKKKLQKQNLLVIGKGSDCVAITIDQPPVQVKIDLANESSDLPEMPELLKDSVDKCYSHDLYWLDWDFKKFFSSAGLNV